MSKLSQFYFNDNVGDYRESQDFYTDLSGAFDVYDDGYKFYVRTGTYVLNPPDRVRSNTEIMEKYGFMSAAQQVAHRQWSTNYTATALTISTMPDDGIVSANGWYMASFGGPITTGSVGTTSGQQSSLVMRSDDEFATFKLTDISPYVYQHITTANGIPFIYASCAALGTTLFAPQRANVLKSHDGGETWTPVLPEDVWNYKTMQVVYLNNRYFIVTDHGIWYSEDAYADTWTKLKGPFNAVSYSNDFLYLTQVVGFGTAYTVYPTSITWDGTRYSVAVSSEYSVGTGTANCAQIVYNTELTEFGWSRATLNDSGNTIAALVRANDKTFAIFRGRGMQYSSTGTSYAQCVNLYSYNTSNTVTGLLWDSANSRYWASSANGLFQSADGVTFTQATGSTGLQTNITIKSGVIYSVNTAQLVARTTSATAIATTQQTGNVIGNFVTVANDKIFVFGSNTGGHQTATITPGSEGAIRTTTDGTTFTNKLLIGQLRQFYIDEAANSLLILMANSVIKFNATTQVYSCHMLPAVANTILKTANNLYTIGSHHSPDLVTWTAASGATGLNSPVITMAMSANGMIVAANSGQNRYSTTNGTTWTQMTGTYCNFIEYGSGVFVGLSSANSQNVQVSYTGTGWQGGDFNNTPALALRSITYDSLRNMFWLGGWFQNYAYGTFDHTNRAPDTFEVGSLNPYANTDAIVVTKEPSGLYANTTGYHAFILDVAQSRVVTIRPGGSTSSFINVANGGVQWTAVANDLMFMHITSGSTAYAFGTPNTAVALRYGPATGSFRANAYTTGTQIYGYNTSGSSTIWKNTTLNSCVKFDGKYWVPPIVGTIGWSQFKKDILYIPGDGTKFLRVY